MVSDSQYLAGIDGGRVENLVAPQLAPDYRQLPKSSNLRDVVLIIRADEAGHRDRNHAMADALSAA